MPELANFQRSTKPLFDRFRLTEKWHIFALKYDTSILKKQTTIPLHGKKDNPLFLTTQIIKEDFVRLKEKSKAKGVTVNDIILTSYARAISKKTDSDRVIIPCPVDLRKYLLPSSNLSICNLTSNYFCDLTIRQQDSFNDALEQIMLQMKQQKSSLNILKSVILAEAAFRTIPFRTMQKVFHKLFIIPEVSFTNLGQIDKNKLIFEGTAINAVYLTGAIKNVPYFQIAVSTYDDCCTLSCNMYGTLEDKILIESFLKDMLVELEET